ncbi:coiled-coil domain-containing protein 42 like-2 isoform X2 [Oryzias melastigma]|nr:coiled-coil domain-containing protein 42 like-2 isoform X2 [Oryzias melastigma]
MLEDLQQQSDMLRTKIKEAVQLRASLNTLLKEEDSNSSLMKARELFEKERSRGKKEIQTLKEEKSKVTETKQKLQRQKEELSVYADMLRGVCRLTKFEDVDQLARYIEGQLHITEKLTEKEKQVLMEMDQQRKELSKVQEKQNLLRHTMNGQLYQLQTEIEEIRSEAEVWEMKWDHIQDTAARKTLELCQIKMITLNLFETLGGVNGEKAISMSDTETQLEQIATRMKDMEDILKMHKDLYQAQGSAKGKPEEAPT